MLEEEKILTEQAEDDLWLCSKQLGLLSDL